MVAGRYIPIASERKAHCWSGIYIISQSVFCDEFATPTIVVRKLLRWLNNPLKFVGGWVQEELLGACKLVRKINLKRGVVLVENKEENQYTRDE